MHKVISKDGTTIAYHRAGEGAPIILIDGAGGSRSFGPLSNLAQPLSRHFSVLHYDRRGRGDSGDTLPYAIEREIEDLEAVIRAAGGSAYLFGVSSGAVLCLIAAASGLNIRKLALYEPPVEIGKSDPSPLENAALRITELSSSGHRGEAVALFLTEMIGVPTEAIASMQHTSAWKALEDVAPTLAYDVTIVGDRSLNETIASAAVPTLALYGENSPPPIIQAVRSVAEALPNVQLRSLKGQSHGIEIPPEVLVPVLEAFFGA